MRKVDIEEKLKLTKLNDGLERANIKIQQAGMNRKRKKLE